MTGSHSGYCYGVLEVFLRFIPEHNSIKAWLSVSKSQYSLSKRHSMTSIAG
ncbi:hypothetical protein ACRN93_02860 [Shewanella baltica]|uniref:hypothetical protein n=1 Tax=Shewanella TaxID=22 RepID=UPI00200403DD|nr:MULTISPECIES: hypothetical protein [unclassified Shewanella]MCK7632101.1 hypothetical protein [Shewanella sp. JNE9-1]MCK7647253.1 hypothetical protein [Shewanella sp. JNE3-1]MCK7655399.1 hypothetical protein [Shewanella sp. JNE4-1]UPO26259.1 hypothetical protein MZ018_15260 [Shewanella sp. JNE10-2]UPO37243.1 hypothetical protein MZ097_10200 [Shewanella sp. JNE7]